MAPWARKIVVEVMRNVKFGVYFENRDGSLVMDWICDIRKQIVKVSSGVLQTSTLCELWCFLLKWCRLKEEKLLWEWVK